MYQVDELRHTQTCIDDKWVTARPLKDPRIIERIKDAVAVLRGKADAVTFYKQ